MTNRYLHAEYREPEEAVRAVEALRRAGVQDGALELYSNRPVEIHPPVLPRRSRMSLVAVVTAILMGTVVTALVFRIQLDFPLVTGGMPITSGWATAVVTFEATMAGSVIGILAMLVLEGGLLRRSRSQPPVPALPDDGVVLQVRCEGEPAEVERALAETGPVWLESVAANRV